MAPVLWKSWHVRLKALKRGMPDVEIAAAVEESLQQGGRPGYTVKRAQVNHWLNGRRVPDLAEFFALCAAIGADPGEILFGERVLPSYTVPGSHANHTLKAHLAQPAAPYRIETKAAQFKRKRRARRRILP